MITIRTGLTSQSKSQNLDSYIEVGSILGKVLNLNKRYIFLFDLSFRSARP